MALTGIVHAAPLSAAPQLPATGRTETATPIDYATARFERVAHALRVTEHIVIDGRLTEANWQRAEPAKAARPRLQPLRMGDREHVVVDPAQVQLAERVPDEPEPLPFPARHWLGAAMLEGKRPADAERVYREDLKEYAENGWSLYGLAQSLRAQGKAEEAAAVDERFRRAWARADVTLTASRF